MQIKTILIFIAVTIGVLGGVGGLLWQFGTEDAKPVEDIAGEMRHVRGSGEVILVEFSDFQCPACQAVQEPLMQILDKYEGKVEFVYRYFPLNTIHKNAQIAAQAAEAAGRYDKFWQMHDKLFETQSEWEGIADPREMMVGYAQEIGIDKDKFASELESQEVRDGVNNDSLSATRYQLTGTPTFFINGVKVEFGQIEAKLASLVK